MAGAERAAKPAGQLRNMDGRQPGFRIHLPDVRREDQRRAGLFEQGEVGGFVARIGGEILVRPELGWVDEDGRNDGVATRSSRVDEADMAGVQRPHCRREANGKSFCAQFGDAPAQAGDRALDAQPFRQFAIGGACDRIVPKVIHAAPAGRKRLAVADYSEIRRRDGNNRACAFPCENLQRNLRTELLIRCAAEDSRHAQRPILQRKIVRPPGH